MRPPGRRVDTGLILYIKSGAIGNGTFIAHYHRLRPTVVWTDFFLFSTVIYIDILIFTLSSIVKSKIRVYSSNNEAFIPTLDAQLPIANNSVPTCMDYDPESMHGAIGSSTGDIIVILFLCIKSYESNIIYKLNLNNIY